MLLLCRPVEAGHQKVQVCGQGIHHNNLFGEGADNGCTFLRHVLGHVLPANKGGVLETLKVAIHPN